MRFGGGLIDSDVDREDGQIVKRLELIDFLCLLLLLLTLIVFNHLYTFL